MLLLLKAMNVFIMFSTAMNKERKKEITIQPIFWKDYASKDGKSPIKLKVTANRRTKNYPIKKDNKNLMLSPEQWADILKQKPKLENRKAKEVVDKAKVRALEAVESITKGGRPFTHERFEKEYFSQPVSLGFMGAFEKYLNELLSENRIGTHNSYMNAYRALDLFLKHKKLDPSNFTAYDLTYDFLKELENYLLETRGKTTLGIYARTYRIIYNYCAAKDYHLKELYPFGKGHGKYKIQSSLNGPKKGEALTTEELRKFVQLDFKRDSPEFYAKSLWLFSFYCQGMNFKDMCLLRYSNIRGQTIRYIREKTKRTGQIEVIEIPLEEPIREIIVQIGNPDKRPEAYLFDLLPPEETDPLALEPLLKQALKTTNKWLKRLCLENGLPKMTTYWSRHTYASLLKFQGVSVEIIRELLGHTDIKTTEHYLKRFDLAVKRDINNRLYKHILSEAS
jgi:integrase/recombinase XerD